MILGFHASFSTERNLFVEPPLGTNHLYPFGGFFFTKTKVNSSMHSGCIWLSGVKTRRCRQYRMQSYIKGDYDHPPLRKLSELGLLWVTPQPVTWGGVFIFALSLARLAYLLHHTRKPVFDHEVHHWW